MQKIRPDFAQLLHAQGFRATPGRMALLNRLWLAKRPLTVDEVGRSLDLNVVTVYRALNELAQRGLVLRGMGQGDATHFSYPENHHHHLVCIDCSFEQSCHTC